VLERDTFHLLLQVVLLYHSSTAPQHNIEEQADHATAAAGLTVMPTFSGCQLQLLLILSLWFWWQL